MSKYFTLIKVLKLQSKQILRMLHSKGTSTVGSQRILINHGQIA